MRLEKGCEVGTSGAWGPHGKEKDTFRQRMQWGQSPGRGWGPAIQAQESGIAEKAEGGSSRIKGWRLLRVQWRPAENALNKLEKAARKLPSDCATGPGDAILPGQESQEREVCFSIALKGKHSSWGSYPQE